jgi:hypothetical protein
MGARLNTQVWLAGRGTAGVDFVGCCFSELVVAVPLRVPAEAGSFSAESRNWVV